MKSVTAFYSTSALQEQLRNFSPSPTVVVEHPELRPAALIVETKQPRIHS